MNAPYPPNTARHVHRVPFMGSELVAWTADPAGTTWHAAIVDADGLVAYETTQSEYGKAVGVAKRWQKKAVRP